MRNIILFVEDYGHQTVVESILQRLAREHQLTIKLSPRSVRGGHGKAIAELKSYLKQLRAEVVEFPDLLIAAVDANCKGYQDCKKEIDKIIASSLQSDFISAVPDPHIERWLLLDSAAFKAVMGKGCSAPDQKCQRDRYKKLLMAAMLQAGVHPPLGGFEYAEDIINKMDFDQMERHDCSLGQFLKSVRSKFKEWS